MKTLERLWQKPAQPVLKEMPLPVEKAEGWQCIFGRHKADVLHRGTAYCRSCYDEKNRLGELVK